jgi:hypothetical protein
MPETAAAGPRTSPARRQIPAQSFLIPRCRKSRSAHAICIASAPLAHKSAWRTPCTATPPRPSPQKTGRTNGFCANGALDYLCNSDNSCWANLKIVLKSRRKNLPCAIATINVISPAYLLPGASRGTITSVSYHSLYSLSKVTDDCTIKKE